MGISKEMEEMLKTHYLSSVNIKEKVGDMTGDEELIHNLTVENLKLKDELDQWKDLYFEAKELIADYRNLVYSKEHSDER